MREPAVETGPGPTVSVVIPTFNRVDILPRAVQTVLGQTFTRWELIIVDDASVDDTSTYLASLTDPRFKVLRHPKNRGGSAARNTGIAAAGGRFLAFLDSDDEWLPHKLERQLGVFDDPSVGVVYSGYFERRPGGLVEVRARQPEEPIFEHLIALRGVSKTSTIVVRRSLLDPSSDLFDESLPAHQEWDFMCRLAKKLEFRAVSEPLIVLDRSPRIDRVGASHNKVRAAEVILTKYLPALRERPKAAAAHHIQSALHYGALADAIGARPHLAAAIRLWPRWQWRFLWAVSYLGTGAFSRIVNLYRAASERRASVLEQRAGSRPTAVARSG